MLTVEILVVLMVYTVVVTNVNGKEIEKKKRIAEQEKCTEALNNQSGV